MCCYTHTHPKEHHKFQLWKPQKHHFDWTEWAGIGVFPEAKNCSKKLPISHIHGFLCLQFSVQTLRSGPKIARNQGSYRVRSETNLSLMQQKPVILTHSCTKDAMLYAETPKNGTPSVSHTMLNQSNRISHSAKLSQQRWDRPWWVKRQLNSHPKNIGNQFYMR